MWPPGAAEAVEPECGKVQDAVDAFARAPPADATVLRRLAPYMGERAPRDLLVHVGRPDPTWQYDIYLAIGFTRQAEGRRVLMSNPPSAPGLPALGHALGLLALGDGAGTPTIAAALGDPSVQRRRLVSQALSRMRHNRPLTMLWEVLEDEDPQVRLRAARGLLPTGSRRARRELRRLAESGPGLVRRMAAQAILEADLRFPSSALAGLPPGVRAQAVAAEASRGRRAVLRALPVQLQSSDPDRRSGAFAGLAHREAPGRLARLARHAVRRFGGAASAELMMAQSLAGDLDAAANLAGLAGAGVSHAVAVLWAFAGAGDKRARIDEDAASAIAKAVVEWLGAGAVDARGTSQVLRALEALDPLSAANVARARLGGADDWGLRTAFRVLARHGEGHDVAPLFNLANRLTKPQSRVEALRAAVRICHR